MTTTCFGVALLAVTGTLLHAAGGSDESAIRAARERSNRAIAAHDLDAAAAVWSADYVGVSSGNGRSIGRDEERRHFADLIATRPGVLFVRTPESIAVNVAETFVQTSCTGSHYCDAPPAVK